jgi:hypothetical protein
MAQEEMDFDTWLAYGVDHKWAMYPVCYMHDGVPTTEDEENEMEEGGDPCMHVIRVFSTEEEFDSAMSRMQDILPYRLPQDL